MNLDQLCRESRERIARAIGQRKRWHLREFRKLCEKARIKADLTAPVQSEDDPTSALPKHLREDAPFLVCTGCGRKSWDTGEYCGQCGMPQPNGTACKGTMLAPPTRDTESGEKL